MAHNIERSLSSLTAIAAASLLLSTTPVLAQSQPADAQPPAAAPAPAAVIDAQPAPAAAASAEPQMAAPAAPASPAPDAAPAATNPTVTANPVVQAVPAETAQPAATPASQTTTAPAAAHPATQRTATRNVRAIPAPQTTGGIPAATPVEKPQAAAPAKDTSSSGLTRRDPAGLYTPNGEPTATTTTASSNTQIATRQSPFARYWPLEAAGGIVLIGLIGYAFTRRRDDEIEEVYTPATLDEPIAEPIATNPVMPVMAAAPAIAEDTAQAAVLPAGPVPEGAQREALLQRMVDAEPDAANPFHTVKARMRRARMILASRKQALRDQATEAFDWRTYRPSLQHATLGSQAAPKREPVK